MSSSKRPHQKSRNGCIDCKARRVKCDEEWPTCNSCRRREVECVYPNGNERGTARLHDHASASLTPKLLATEAKSLTREAKSLLARSRQDGLFSLNYSARELLNLRLMHHYGTVTVESFASTFKLGHRVLETLQKDVPLLAFQHEFLMDTILAVAMIHLGCTDLDSRRFLPIILYRDQAIRNFRQAVANLSEDNKRAVMVTSLLLASTSIAADRVTEHSGLWVTNWLAMAMGPRIFFSFVKASDQWDNPYGTPPAVYTLGHFVDHPAPAAIPVDLETVLWMQDDDEDWVHQAVLYQAATSIGKLIGALALPDHQSWIEFKVRAWPFSMTTSQFIDLVRQERPRALITLGYYLALLKFLPDVWLYEGTARQDMEKLDRMLDPKLRHHLTVPKAALQIDDQAALTEFLVGQLPAEALADESSFQLFFALGV